MIETLGPFKRPFPKLERAGMYSESSLGLPGPLVNMTWKLVRGYILQYYGNKTTVLNIGRCGFRRSITVKMAEVLRAHKYWLSPGAVGQNINSFAAAASRHRANGSSINQF